MPKYTNSFASPAFIEEKIVKSEDAKAVGTIRVKPVSISWKAASKGDFLTKSLDDFIAWITNPATKARKTKS